MHLTLQTYLDDFPYLDDAGKTKYIGLNVAYIHEVFARVYKMNYGHIYCGISFTLNGEKMFKEMVETDDLFATWSSLLSYYEKEDFQPKESHDLFFWPNNIYSKKWNGR